MSSSISCSYEWWPSRLLANGCQLNLESVDFPAKTLRHQLDMMSLAKTASKVQRYKPWRRLWPPVIFALGLSQMSTTRRHETAYMWRKLMSVLYAWGQLAFPKSIVVMYRMSGFIMAFPYSSIPRASCRGSTSSIDNLVILLPCRAKHFAETFV